MPSEILITFIVTSSIAAFLAILKYTYKYKFTNLTLCGCCKLERDVTAETTLDTIEANKPPEETKKLSDASDITPDSNTTTTSNEAFLPSKFYNTINLSSSVV
jgi:hypothetical protein